MNESARAPLIVITPRQRFARRVCGRVCDLGGTVRRTCARRTGVRELYPRSRRPGAFGTGKRLCAGAEKLGHSLYTRDFRYLEWPDGGRQLYHALTDPHEYENLANDPRYADTLEEMRERLERRVAKFQPGTR